MDYHSATAQLEWALSFPAELPNNANLRDWLLAAPDGAMFVTSAGHIVQLRGEAWVSLHPSQDVVDWHESTRGFSPDLLAEAEWDREAVARVDLIRLFGAIFPVAIPPLLCAELGSC